MLNFHFPAFATEGSPAIPCIRESASATAKNLNPPAGKISPMACYPLNHALPLQFLELAFAVSQQALVHVPIMFTE